MNLTAAIRGTSIAVLLAAASIGARAAEAPAGIVEDPCPPMLAPPAALVGQVRKLLLEPHVVTPAELKTFQDDPQLKAYNEATFARARSDWANLCRYREDNARVRASGVTPRAVFMGDSITEFWSVADAAFFGEKVINRGISGQTTPQMLVRFQADVVALRPQVVHILAGTNDVAGNTGPTSPADFKNNIKAMVEMAKANRIAVILGSVPPTAAFNWRPQLKPVPIIQALNVWLRDYAAQQNIGFVDYYSALAGSSGELKADLANEGVHPNLNGYRIMRKLVEEKLSAAASSAPPVTDQRAALDEARARQAALPDTPGSGKFPALKEEAASLPDHVIYRPADLAALGKTKLGLYIFGNGACSNDGASARLHLLEIASHGYLAIASGRIRTGPGAGATAAPSTLRTRSEDLSSALDWALAQNADPASPYYKKIDPRMVAVSGFSCGGLQALEIAHDPRIRTLIVMNSGIVIPGSSPPIPGMDQQKSLLETLHTPTLYILGGETDIAYGNGVDDFRRIDKVPVFLGNILRVGHGGTYWEPNGGKAAAAVVAWLDWQLRGNRIAAQTFKGERCGLCADPAWAVEKKRIE